MSTNPSSRRQRPAGSWLRFLAAVIVLLLVAVGIPIGLVIAARAGLGSSSPIPEIGSWNEIRDWATTQRSSTEIARVALRVLITLCWSLWALLVLSVASSVVQSRPRFGHVRLPRMAMFDEFGAWLVAGLTALTSLAPNISHATSATTVPLRAAAMTAAASTPAHAPTSVTATPSFDAAPARAGWETVQAAESIEMFSARALGSADRWPEVFELNKGRTMADGTTFTHAWSLHAGWQLELPTTQTAAAAIEEVATGPTSNPNAMLLSAEDVVVADGDNLWDLATARLRSVGADDSDGAVAALVAEVVSVNPSIDDPNLVYTDQHILMPAISTLVVDEASPDAPAPPLAATTGGDRTHTIVYGDTLWDIVESTYGYVNVPLVHHVADYNAVADPDNIPIGTVVLLPTLPGPVATTDTQQTTEVSTPVADLIPAPPPSADIGGADTRADPGPPTVTAAPMQPTPAAHDVDPVEASRPRSDELPVPTSTDSTTPPPLRLVPSQPAPVEGQGPTSSPVPWAIGGAASVALATGVLELIRRRRRARWARGGSSWHPGAASEQPPAEILESADLITIEWVAATLSHVAATTATTDASLTTVEYDESVLSVRWDRPQPTPANPWWASEDGLVWNLPSSARLSPPDDGPLVGFPGLVTLGERNGRQFLLNLAAVRTIAIDGPAADELAGSIALELGAGELLSDSIVHLHGMELTACEQLDRVMVGFDDDLDPASRTMHVSISESDDPALNELIAAAQRDARRAVVILGTSPRAVCAEVRAQRDGTAVLDPAGVAFVASRVSGALISLETTELAVEAAALEIPEPNVVRLDRTARGGLIPPRMVLRVFSNLLPDLDPRPAGVDARAMTVIAALDYLGTGRPPQELAELLRIKTKTIQNKLGRLRELNLVHSDGNTWTLDAGVCSDADWMCDLAEHARDSTCRETANRALNECWELLARATGPAYANGGGSPLWGWVGERDQDFGGATAIEQATDALFHAARVAVETWDVLAASGVEDLISPDKLIDVLLRLESTLHTVEPWPLFEVAAVAAGRTGLASTRQKLSTRLAQLVHDSDLKPPDELVAQVIGWGAH